MDTQKILQTTTCLSGPTLTGDVISPQPSAPSRSHPRVSQVCDVDGTLWDVREGRQTKHGFDLLFGKAANSHLATNQGKAQLIATPALIAYWETNRIRERAIRDLPASVSTLNRIRREQGFNFYRDRRAAWQERTADLKNLTTHQFAEKYRVDPTVALNWHHLLLGLRGRPLNWWKEPSVLEVLRSGLSHRQAAAKLGLSSDTHVRKLRARAGKPDCDAPLPLKASDELPLPPRWQTSEALAILRSKLPHTQAAAQLRVTPARIGQLRSALAKGVSPNRPTPLTPIGLAGPLSPTPPRDLQVTDIDGALWDLKESAPTRHGFDIFFGFRASQPVSERLRSRYIVTPDLLSYWQNSAGHAYDLPLSRTFITDLRRTLGLTTLADRRAFWQSHLADLKELTAVEFAQRHNVPVENVYQRRRKLLGRMRRPLNWWRTDPAILALFRSNAPIRELAGKFGLSVDQTYHIRKQARAL